MTSVLGHGTESGSAGSGDSDQVLAVRAKHDGQLFGVLYDRYVDRIYRYCYRRLRSEAAAEDATSQTFLKAFAALPGYQDNALSFRAWLFAIAHNVVVDMWRWTKPDVDLDLVLDLATDEPGPESLAIASEQRRELQDLVALLPDDQAHLIHLRLGGLSDREIAVVLDRSYGAIRIAQHRAIKRLKALAEDRSDMQRTTRQCG